MYGVSTLVSPNVTIASVDVIGTYCFTLMYMFEDNTSRNSALRVYATKDGRDIRLHKTYHIEGRDSRWHTFNHQLSYLMPPFQA
jgi:hypothetical protein